MDYCALATARSIPVAQEIATRFDELKLEHDIGHLQIKISGCINACGHHHVGHIGILGLDRAGVENYQITLGGDATENAPSAPAPVPAFAYDEIVPAVERIVDDLSGSARNRGRDLHRDLSPRRHGSLQGRALPRGDRKRWPAAWLTAGPGPAAEGRSTGPTGILAEKVGRAECPLPHHSATAVMEGALKRCRQHCAGRPAFGAESVVLLHMAAIIDPMTPVLFVDTELLFTETLVYQQEVSERLGLRNVQHHPRR